MVQFIDHILLYEIQCKVLLPILGSYGCTSAATKSVVFIVILTWPELLASLNATGSWDFTFCLFLCATYVYIQVRLFQVSNYV